MNERKRVISAHEGGIYEVWNEFESLVPNTIIANYRYWSPSTNKWGEELGSGGFPKNAPVLYDSANLLAGIPEGTEWVDTHGRYRLVAGKFRYCNWTAGSLWIDAYSEAHNILKLPRYNPDTTVYTPPDWLAALRAEAAKPVIEEGKFYRPERGLNSALIFRKHKGGIQFWSGGMSWTDTSPDFYYPGTTLLEVPNPEPPKLMEPGKFYQRNEYLIYRFNFSTNTVEYFNTSRNAIRKWCKSHDYTSRSDIFLDTHRSLVEVPNPEPAMEEGKFYTPVAGPNAGTVYRVEKGGQVSFWDKCDYAWARNWYPSVESFLQQNRSTLREVPSPEPAKPVMDEGKFYSPNRGADRNTVFRLNKGIVEFWYPYRERWETSFTPHAKVEDFAAFGGLREVSNPEPQKPVMEEGKFYSPNSGPDSGVTYRIKNNQIQYWYNYNDMHWRPSTRYTTPESLAACGGLREVPEPAKLVMKEGKFYKPTKGTFVNITYRINRGVIEHWQDPTCGWIKSYIYNTEAAFARDNPCEAQNPEPKPVMEEGKFYTPTEKYNIGTVYRVNADGTVSFWFEIKKRWENSDPNVDSFIIRNGSKVREVPNPEPTKPCYIAADGRKIPVGSKIVYLQPEKHYADFTVEKTDGSGTWRKRSTGEVDPNMATFGIESCLKNSLYRLELPK